MFYKDDGLTVYFGDAHDALFSPYTDTVLSVQKKLNLTHLVLAKQVHGVDGLHVTEKQPHTIAPFTHEADFIMTKERGIGIGVLTADCVPLVLYDAKQKVCAVIHAGWRGTVEGVAVKALEALQTTYGVQSQDVSVLIGPFARTCCYMVDQAFVQRVAHIPYAAQSIVQKNNKLAFDLHACLTLQLQDAGVREDAISVKYAVCTICSHRYWSYRRQKEQAGRNITIVFLNI